MAIIRGNEFVILLNGTRIPGQVATSLSFTDKLVEVTLSDSGPFPQFISGVKDTTITVDLLNFDHPIDLGDKIEFEILNTSNGWRGEGFVESVDVNSGSDEAVTRSVTIKLTGPLENRELTEGFLLLEDDCFFLLEDECKLIIETFE